MDQPGRLAPPEFPTDDVVIAAPPPLQAAGVSTLAPLIVLVATAGGAALMWWSGMWSRGPSALVLPVMMVVSAIGMALQFGSRRPGPRLDEQRRLYLAELHHLGDQLSEAARRQRESLVWVHPPPSTLWTLTAGPRRWERRVTDSDFCHIRVGLARQRLARRLVLPPTGPAAESDPVTADALRRLVRNHAVVDDLPVAVAIGAVGILAVGGRPQGARALVRAMVCQLAVLHGPDAVAIVAVTDDRQHWDWLKWLPHNADPVQGSAMVYTDTAAAGSAVTSLRESDSRRLVIVVDGADHRGLAGSATSLVVLGDVTGALQLQVDADRLAVRTAGRVEEFGCADNMPATDALICARRLARHRAAQLRPDEVHRWCAQAGLAGPSDPPAAHGWPSVTPGDRLRVILGATADGVPVALDIKEPAEGGQGPHGLCIGATGSGKSELLRTAVLGMAVRHSPDELNVVLIDFKGGATFLGMEGLHHVAAVITNLADEAHLVARAIDALGGEIHRRQHLLRQAGNAVNLSAYRRRQRSEPTLPTLPALLVVVDEFAELLHLHPEFADLFTMIGRVGRSLGVHLLLASQRLDEGRLRGLEAHLSYRICLKTTTAAESRAVIGAADAAELPAAPGAALIRDGNGRLTRFQATYLGVAATGARPEPTKPVVQLFTSAPAAPPPAGADVATVFDVVIGRLRGLGSRAHQIWLPPLTSSPQLAELTDGTAGELSAVIGVIDLPFEQRRSPLRVDAAGAGGHIAVVGAPRSGKSDTVRTLLTALAAGHGPRRIQFYGLDFGGGTLTTLTAYPHVGSVATRQEPELVRRIVAHIGAIIAAREVAPRADDYGDVFLVVDGWPTVRDEFADLEATITGFAGRGLSFGVHLILTANRWADLRPALKDQIGTRIELRLGDPLDSDIDRKQAALVPIGSPGRGITRQGEHFLIARVGGACVARDGSWRAPAVRLLPDQVDHDDLVAEAGRGDQILLGLGETDLRPVAVDFSRQAHLLILGDRECGKTAALRVLCRELARSAGTRPVLVFLVDYRRDLLGAADPEQLYGHAFSESRLRERLAELVVLLEGRLPTEETTADQLRPGSWWAGSEVFVIVDDYDLVAATAGDVFAPLLTVLPHAADIGLHLVVARRCAGTGRAMFDPVLAQLRDSGCMGLLMNGNPDEGALIGQHRATAQPRGRGLLVTDAGAQRLQVGWCPP